jgi:hypothetical protein
MALVESAPRAQVRFRTARTRATFSQAFSLVYYNYVEAGLIEPNQAQVRVLPHHALPTTDVLVAQVRDEVFGTATLIRDGRYGLPLESIYTSEVENYRNEGLRLAEVSCLADRRRRTNYSSLIDLMHFTIQCAIARGVDQLLIAVHPRHVKFYVRLLGFNVFAGLRNYAAVCDNPAIGLSLDLRPVDVWDQATRNRVLGRKTWSRELIDRPISYQAKKYIETVLQSTDVDAPQCQSMPVG